MLEHLLPGLPFMRSALVFEREVQETHGSLRALLPAGEVPSLDEWRRRCVTDNRGTLRPARSPREVRDEVIVAWLRGTTSNERTEGEEL